MVNCIKELRGEKFILDKDLAELYGLEAKRLSEHVRRNQSRFPSNFIIQLNEIKFVMAMYIKKRKCDH